MRQIEHEMVRALTHGSSWKKDNTAVVPDGGDGFDVFLSGNHIAYLSCAGTLFITLAGWNSRTTRSRLNALLSSLVPGRRSIHTRKGRPFFGDAEIEPDTVIRIDSNGIWTLHGELP